MSHHDWSHFTKRIPIQADASDIFDAWTIPAELERWFLRKAHFMKPDKTLLPPDDRIQKDDTYQWFWHGWSDEVAESGTVLQIENNRLLKFTFGKAGAVEVSMKKEHGATICELTQDQIPGGEEAKVNYYVGCGEGWTFYLANLKSILEGGIDLRNKDEKLERVINS